VSAELFAFAPALFPVKVLADRDSNKEKRIIVATMGEPLIIIFNLNLEE
jgi:hypothetical protein